MKEEILGGKQTGRFISLKVSMSWGLSYPSGIKVGNTEMECFQPWKLTQASFFRDLIEASLHRHGSWSM